MKSYNQHPPINSLADKLANLPLKFEAVQETKKQAEPVVKYVNQKVGAISPQARELLSSLTSEYDQFTLGVAMNKVSEKFTCDMGLAYLEKVQQVLASDCL